MSHSGRTLTVVRYQDFAPWPRRSSGQPGNLVAPAARGCVPFRQASALGWYIFPPFDATVTWRGGRSFEVTTDNPVVERIWAELMAGIHGSRTPWWCSKINGVFQIDPGLVFITVGGIKTLLTGPVNRPNVAYWVQTGLLDSDWFWVPNTINLQVWRRDVPFKLRKEEPIAQVIPISANLRDIEEPAFADIADRPEIAEQWKTYRDQCYGPVGEDGMTGPRVKRGIYARWKRAAEGKSRVEHVLDSH